METLQFKARVFDKNTKKHLEKILTIRTTPSTNKREETAKSYLFLLGCHPNILVDNFEVIEDESSSDWNEYFEFFTLQNPLFIVVGVQSKIGPQGKISVG